jgi:hypothetical protein
MVIALQICHCLILVGRLRSSPEPGDLPVSFKKISARGGLSSGSKIILLNQASPLQNSVWRIYEI